MIYRAASSYRQEIFFSLCNFINCSGIIIGIIIIVIGVGGSSGGLIGFQWGSSSSKCNVEVCIFVCMFKDLYISNVFSRIVLFQIPIVVAGRLFFTVLIHFLICHMATL
jgi:hypothetical protein